jgi:Cu2+-containing amine oxidase
MEHPGIQLVESAGWRVHYTLTTSAGVRIFAVDFHGRRVLWEATLPYVTIDHQRTTLKPEDDLPDQHGPWWTPLGERTLQGEIRRVDFRGGFEIVADFAAGPYRYTQMWRFHADGRMEPWLTLHGPGAHDAHTYHPHWRFDFDVDGSADDAVEHWHKGRWTRVEEEGWFPYTGDASPEGYVWRQVDFASGASVNIRPQHWEDAELFALRYHDGEWAPYTPRAAVSEQPFPAGYVDNEPLDGQDVTLWYVAHVHHDQAFPFTAGPWIRVQGL